MTAVFVFRFLFCAASPFVLTLRLKETKGMDKLDSLIVDHKIVNFLMTKEIWDSVQVDGKERSVIAGLWAGLMLVTWTVGLSM